MTEENLGNGPLSAAALHEILHVAKIANASLKVDEYQYVGLSGVIGNRANGQFPQNGFRKLAL
jgi:hypothetical protein